MNGKKASKAKMEAESAQRLARIKAALGSTQAPEPAAKAQTPQGQQPVAHASFEGPTDPMEKAAEKAKAILALQSSVNAALVVDKFTKRIFPGVSLQTLHEELEGCVREVADGNMQQAETMLMAQAIALQSIFMNLASRVPGQEFVHNQQTYLAMALKAQNQSRMTLETLNELKNPRPVAFIRTNQANVSHGHQQVNNQMASRGEKPENEPNELLEQTHGERVEQRATAATEHRNPTMEAVAPIDGSQNSDR